MEKRRTPRHSNKDAANGARAVRRRPLAKQASFWSRAVGRGGGEALPGLLAERVAPHLLGTLAGRLPRGSVVVTGTNGKTTTALAISFILEEAGLRVLRNRGGSNLTRGLVSALVQSSRVTRPYPSEDIGLFEVDEATMPQSSQTRRAFLVTTCFATNDRYGRRQDGDYPHRHRGRPEATNPECRYPAVAPSAGSPRPSTWIESENSRPSALAIDSPIATCCHTLISRLLLAHRPFPLPNSFSLPPLQVCAEGSALHHGWSRIATAAERRTGDTSVRL